MALEVPVSLPNLASEKVHPSMCWCLKYAQSVAVMVSWALCKVVHGFGRTNELRDALNTFSPFVALREDRIVAYASAVTFWPLNHGVAETEEDMKALLVGAGAMSQEPLSFLLPVRQAGFFRWCLNGGLRVVKPMTLMVKGKYQEPNGCYFTSVLY